jgi:hypothetical protein
MVAKTTELAISLLFRPIDSLNGEEIKSFGTRASGDPAGWYSDGAPNDPTAPFGGQLPFHFIM